MTTHSLIDSVIASAIKSGGQFIARVEFHINAWASCPPYLAEGNPRHIDDARYLNIQVDTTSKSPYAQTTSQKYTISDPEEAGDGTVPKRSGTVVKEHAKAYFELLRVGHEPAYKNENAHAQRAALYGIVKIAQRIKEVAGMAYK